MLPALFLLVACEQELPVEVPAEAPVACSDAIYVPTAGTSASDPVLADPSVSVLGASPKPMSLHRGIHKDPARDATFVWTTDVATLPSIVKIRGEPDGLEVGVAGASFPDTTGNIRIHEVRVCGLSPESDYTYKAGGDGAWSSTFSFHTAPGTAESAIRIAVAGDSRDSPETWDAALAAMAAHRPEFILFTGDAVAQGYSQDLWDDWFASGAGIVERIPILAIHGNHEALAWNYFANMSLPGNEQWFDLDWGPIHLVVLNDTLASSEDEVAENTFLARSFANTDRYWRLASHHQPLWSASGHGSMTERRPTWGKVFDTWPNTWVFNGHNHLYERSVKLRNGVEAADGTVYVVTGSTGAPEYAARKDWFTAVSETVVHYVIMEFSPTTAVMTTYRMDGSILDNLVVRR